MITRVAHGLRRPGTVLAAIAVVIAAAGGATAQSLIDGSDVRNNSLTGADIRNKSLSSADFRGSIRGAGGRQGPQGVSGPVGPVGPAGRLGPAGPTGPQGPAGSQGLKGDEGDTGERGPSNGRYSRGQIVAITAANPPGTELDQLDLTAGRWLLTATATIANGSNGNRTVTCELREDGASSPIASAVPLDDANVAQATAVVLGAVTLTEAKPIVFGCYRDDGTVTVTGGRPQLSAVQVGALDVDPDA